MAANTMLRERLEEIEAQAEPEKEWWEKRREVIRQDFEDELNEEEAAAKTDAKVVSDDDGVLVDPSTPSGTPSKKKKGKK